MKFVGPRDIKQMLVQRARLVYWKKRAGKHEYEELKEGVWLEPALALLRKKVREEWTVNVRCKSVSSLPHGGWHRKAQALPLFKMARNQAGDCGGVQKVVAKSENIEERVEVAKKYRRAPSQ